MPASSLTSNYNVLDLSVFEIESQDSVGQRYILVEAGTLPMLLYGVNWYLKYVAHLQVSPNGMQLRRAGIVLQVLRGPVEKPCSL
jgi:hypothetical protein